MELTQNPQEDVIRQTAYDLWQQEGCPQGQAERHWLLALELLDKTPAAKPQKKKRAPAKTRLAA